MDGSRFPEKHMISHWVLTAKCTCQDLQSTLHNINLVNATRSLISPKILGNKCSHFKPHSLLSRFLPKYHRFSHLNTPPKNTNHKLVHITLSSLTLTSLLHSRLLCYSKMTHATFCYYHASMLTPRNSLISSGFGCHKRDITEISVEGQTKLVWDKVWDELRSLEV